MKYNKIGVLYGGLSAEREVSLSSGQAVGAALARLGHDTVMIDVDHRVDQRLREAAVDAVFIALHGRFGEDGTVQGLLEMMRIPYTGSSMLASALAMDKARTRDLLAMSGSPVARGGLIGDIQNPVLPAELDYPVVIKPALEGSSVGVSIVKTAAALQEAVALAAECSSAVLAERYTPGMEVNVAILSGEVLGAVEISYSREFYDYVAKYSPGGSEHHIPPRLPPQKLSECEKIAADAYRTIGCSGAARVDLIVPAQEEVIILEINTIPGMTPTSLLPDIARSRGISFDQLVARIIESATLHVHS